MTTMVYQGVVYNYSDKLIIKKTYIFFTFSLFNLRKFSTIQ